MRSEGLKQEIGTPKSLPTGRQAQSEIRSWRKFWWVGEALASLPIKGDLPPPKRFVQAG